MEATAEIGTGIVVINDCLSAFSEEIAISQHWNGQEHVSVKDKGARRHSMGGMNCRPKGSGD